MQLVKLKSVKLYEWIRIYLAGVAAYRDGGRPGDTEPQDEAKRLKTIMDELKWQPRFYLSGLDRFLPGLKEFVGKPDSSSVYQFESEEIAKFKAGRRLGSPSHWRLYFAFDVPTYAIRDDEIAGFRRDAVSNPSDAVKTLRALVTRAHEQLGYFLDVFLDRLLDAPLASAEIAGIGIVFSEVMDDIARELARDNRGTRAEIWKKATSLLERGSAQDFAKLMEVGPSICWLASALQRYALPAEYPGASEVWLHGADRVRAVRTMISRFEGLEPGVLFRQPEPLVILRCWYRLGDESGVRSYIQNAAKDDSSFLDVLNSMRSWVNSSQRGVYYPLRKPLIEDFLDADNAKTRLQHLALDGADEQTRRRAAELLEVFEES